MNFAHLVDGIAETAPDRHALVVVTPDKLTERLTYRQLAETSNRLAHSLMEQGIARGTRVMVLLPRGKEAYISYLALLKTGATIMPGSEMLRSGDILYRVRHAEAQAVLADQSLVSTVEEVRHQMPSVTRYLASPDTSTPGWQSLVALQSNGSPDPVRTSVLPDDLAFLSYTSGTTGGPKGVMHTYRWPFEHLKVAGTYWFDAKPDDLAWATAGPGWAKWVWSPFVSVLGNGATGFVYQGRFEPETYLALMAEYRVTLLCATPTEYRLMAKVPQLDRYALSLRSATSAGEPLNREVIETFRRVFGVTVRDGYGQTENTLLVGTLENMEVRPGSMGRPFPGLPVTIVNDRGEPQGPGVVGHIAVHRDHPALFRGYLNDPERTRAAFRGDWYTTGDQGRLDEDGYIWFEGRSDDIIISAGYTIGPFEVEDALVKHPKVAECAVVASPDEERGHIVKAFVVLRNPEDKNAPHLTEELQAHVKAITAPYKYPRAIEYVDSLPKTTSGKIRRIELREREKAGR
ncbi:acyl-CoA synthetase [Sulfobacillus harzensis]|nr:AMP-binding protein [Sulfobacillus harzensis]